MRFNNIIVFTCLFLVSCNSVREGSIGSLGKQAEVINDDKSVLQQDASVVEYSRFVRLFDTVPDLKMRRDGMRKMAALQFEYNNKQTIPLSEVVKLFESLIEGYPLQQHDRLIYQLSREYEESGERDAALNSLNKLVKEYPDTQYYDEAQFRRGELLFSKRQFSEAESAYKAVVDFRQFGDKSIYYEQAVYKLGWSRFKLNHYTDAIDSFMHLLDLHTQNNDLNIQKMKSSEESFVSDALRAINLSFSYQAGPISIHDYFLNRKKRIYEYQIYASLAKFYEQKKHYSDAVKTYRLFVSSNELHPSSPVFLLKVVDIFDQGGFSGLLLDAKKDFVQRYNIKHAYWGLYENSEISATLLALKTNLHELASYYHAQAQKTGSRLDYRESQRWYRIWLSSFPDDPQAWEMSFLLAENLNEDKQFEAAVRQYESTAYDYKKHPKSAMAGYAALLAYAKREKQLVEFSKVQWHKQSIDSAIRFANQFPQHPEANKVLTRAVENLYALGEYEKAHQIGRQISLSVKDSVLLSSVWIVMAHIEFEWRDYKAAERSYSKALKYLPENAPQRQALVKKQAVTVYKQGEISRQKGDLKSAVKYFSRVKTVSSEAGLVASAEFDAASALIGLRDWARAAIVLKSFRIANPEHKLQPEVTKKLAVVYLEAGDFENASLEFEKVSYLPSQANYQIEALWQAAELSEQTGNIQRAKKLYVDFVKRFLAQLERSVEAMQRLVDLYERSEELLVATKWRVKLVNTDAKGGKQRTDRTRFLAAKASFALAEPVFDAYRKAQLTVPLRSSLKRKRALMDRALKAYSRAASYQVAEVLTASTYRIAEIYQDLGFAIYNSQRPENLNEEELEQYDVLLEEQAYPFEEKAIEFHEINVSRFADGLYGAWVWKSLEQLKEFLPVRYNKKERNDVVVMEIL